MNIFEHALEEAKLRKQKAEICERRHRSSSSKWGKFLKEEKKLEKKIEVAEKKRVIHQASSIGVTISLVYDWDSTKFYIHFCPSLSSLDHESLMQFMDSYMKKVDQHLEKDKEGRYIYNRRRKR